MTLSQTFKDCANMYLIIFHFNFWWQCTSKEILQKKMDSHTRLHFMRQEVKYSRLIYFFHTTSCLYRYTEKKRKFILTLTGIDPSTTANPSRPQ